MPKKRKPSRVPGSPSLPPGMRVSKTEAERVYGPDVSGVIRVDNFPTGPSSFIVQHQYLHADGLSGWKSMAVYRSRAAAELFVARREQGGSTMVDVSLRTGEVTPVAEQPVVEHRIVTLDDLAREGMDALGSALLMLMESDHEWEISTEIGHEAKIALISDHMTGRVGNS